MGLKALDRKQPYRWGQGRGIQAGLAEKTGASQE
jgi:hypothetical protein